MVKFNIFYWLVLNDSLTIHGIDFCNSWVSPILFMVSYHGITSFKGILEAMRGSRFNVCVRERYVGREFRQSPE